MAAYSALVTLSKAIHQILPYEQHYSFLCHKHQMQSLHDKVISFQVFLEDISGKSHSSDDIDELESRIRHVAYQLEDIVEPILVRSLDLEYQNEVNTRLSIQEASLESSIGEANSQLISSIGEASTKLSLTPEGRAASRKSFFRGIVNKICVPCCGCSTVKDCKDNQISAKSEAETSLDDILGGCLEQDLENKAKYPQNLIYTKSEAETSLDDILGWCLDQDLENKAKYSHLPLTERAAASFGNSVEEADLLFVEAMKMKKILDNRVFIATASLSSVPPSATDTKVGLDGDLIQILDQITGRPATFQVVPITGMGGIGKTTLARAVLEHPKTVKRFDVRLWATVSQQYNVKEILQGFLPGKEGLLPGKVILEGLLPGKEILEGLLRGKKILKGLLRGKEGIEIFEGILRRKEGKEILEGILRGKEGKQILEGLLGGKEGKEILEGLLGGKEGKEILEGLFPGKEGKEIRLLPGKEILEGLLRGKEGKEILEGLFGIKEGNEILEGLFPGKEGKEILEGLLCGKEGKEILEGLLRGKEGKEILEGLFPGQEGKEIIEGLLPGKETLDKVVVGKLIEQVHKQLVGRRYLIILDDVWDEKVWDSVRIAFPDDNNYSRVILTTRLSKVATYVSSSSTHAHQMQLLNEERSWDLLRETVYGHGAGCPGEVEGIGRKISRSCKGLPLALVVIGGLLKLNKTRDYWNEVARSTQEKASANDESILKIMSLSYTNLPPHLKACFLYLGVFPEDEEIPTKELVRLWCAEGFLKARESKTMEVVAEECLEELVERNMILVKKKRYNGKIKTSSIHDVLRDLSLRQAHKEKFLYGHHGSSKNYGDTLLRIIKDRPRRVSFPSSYSSPVRTLFRSDRYWNFGEVSDIIAHFKLLRVFGKVEFLPSSAIISCRLKNLRYLHLERDRFSKQRSFLVPKSISKLRNLETLFVTSSCFDDRIKLFLPVEILGMPRLRHLVSEVNIILSPFPASGLDEDSNIECSSLQTLTGLQDFDFTPSALRKLRNLKKLRINYYLKKLFDGDLHHRRDKEFGLDNLVNLQHLEELTISRDLHSSPRVKNIGFPGKLKKLSLRATFLPWEKMTSIGDSLEHLEVMKLESDAFVGEVWEPIEGGFPQLKYLKMEYLYGLEEWRAESTHFPSLEKLVILKCEKLKEVPAEIGDIDTLEKLIVKKYENNSLGAGFEESVRRMEAEQQSAGNDSLQVFILSQDQELHHVDVHG